MAQKILIVEDEQKLADLLADYLKASGFEVHTLPDAKGADAWVRSNKPALILLDIMLPGKDGMEICKDVRKYSRVPIIMVTARVEEIDRLLGLELGADDYICKPFSPREVVARVKAILRRTNDGQTIHVNDLVLDKSAYVAKLHGSDLELTALEFNLLQFLVDHPGHIFSRQQIMENIYIDDRFVSDRTVDSHIKKLRRKFEAIDPQSTLIKSIYGVGYKFTPDA
jgi:two-component system response regulator BaeR